MKMDFFNDELHQEMVDMYRNFAEGVCGPIAAEIDEEERFPEETFAGGIPPHFIHL